MHPCICVANDPYFVSDAKYVGLLTYQELYWSDRESYWTTYSILHPTNGRMAHPVT